ncbi:Ig-like domain-containing protein [Samsonia erythrinae]
MIGVIKFVIGQVFIVAVDGSQRLLVAGDRVYRGEEVVTGANGAVSITLPDGKTLDLGRDSRWSDMNGDASQVASNIADDVTAMQDAIAQGIDPTQALEATAAGNDDTGEAGDGGGSHAAVVLDLTGDVVVATMGYDTEALAFNDSESSVLNGDEIATSLMTVSDSGDITPPSVTVAIEDDGTLRFVFSEPPVGFDLSDITVTNGSVTNLVQDPSDPTRWTATLTPAANFEGDVQVSIPDGSYTDAAGNPGSGGRDAITVDTLPPAASISIDNITADNVINAAESGQTIAVTGKVGDEVKAGDAITVTVGSESYQTTVNADGESWSVSVPGTVLAANTDISATVTTRDAAGNLTTANAQHTYGVDVSAPVASITIDNVTADNVINAAESGRTIAVTGKVGDDVRAGDEVTVTIGGESYQTTVNADGLSWSVNVPGTVLSANSDISATVTTRDAAGNVTTADAQHTYGVDVSAPVASITIDNVTADNVINAAESGQSIAVTGKVGDDVRAGDEVTVTIGGESYQTTVNADGLSWSVSVPGTVLAANGEISATVTARDAAGNVTTANAQHGYGVDVSAPVASISIDNVTADNVINATEAGQSIAVTGKVGDDVRAGDAVTVTVGSETYQTTVNTDGENWSVSVPGSVLAANTDISATVTTRDEAGNLTTADAQHTYGVDVSAPTASITIDNVTADNVINAAESGQTIAVTGKVGDEVKAGDGVTVTVGGETYQTTVDADGQSWSVSVPGSVLSANTDISATVITHDAAGNVTTADTNHTYGVDISAPVASISIDNVTADNVINAAESGQSIAVTGKVGDEVKAGDGVAVTVGGETYQTTVNADGLSWSVNVPGAVLAVNGNISATATTRDAAGNVTTADTNRTYGVDISAPVASITIDNVTSDNVINAAESGQTIAVTGLVGDDVRAGDEVTVTIGGESYQTTVDADSESWSVNVSGSVLAANSDISATVTTRDAAGNITTADAQHTYGVDVSAPVASITIDNVTADNVINAAESGQSIAVTGKVGDEVKAGDAITVTVGSETYQTTVNADGQSWSVNVPGTVLAVNGDVSATVTTRDAAGNLTTANAQHAYGVDVSAPVASITIDNVTADNVINVAESGQTIAVTGKVGDDIRAGDAVTVMVGGETYQTTVDADGESWSVNVPGTVLAANTDISATVITHDAAGNVTTANAQHTYGVDVSAPVASISIDNVTADNVINAAESGQTIAVTGKVGDDVRAGDAITVTVGGETYQTTVNADGLSWSVNVPGTVLAANGEISATVTARDAAGNVTTANAQHAYGVDVSTPTASITIDNVTADNVINATEAGQSIAVTGKVGDEVKAGDAVTVTVGGETYQTTVNADGESWSVSVPGSVLSANTDISATVITHDAAGNITSADAQHTYGVDVSAPTASISIDNVTADNVINAAEASQTIAVTGRVGDDVRAGDAVTVTVGSETYQTTVNADGLSWSVSVPGSVLAANSDISATVTTRDAAGNLTTADAQHAYGVDVSAPVASISIDNVTADNVINAAESGQTIAVTGRVGDDVRVGDAITVTIGGESYQTTVNADGESWSVSVPGSVLAANGDISATVTTRDAAGNITSADAQHTYGVDVSAPTASISIDNVTADNVINAAESGQTIAVTGKVGDEVKAGDAITVTVGGETYQTTVNADGLSWSVSVPGAVLSANSDISATVTTRDAAGNLTTADAQHTYGVDVSAPVASITIDNVTADNVINAAESGETIAVTGRVGDDVRAGDAVTVTIGGESYQTTVNADGQSWSVSVPGTVLAANGDISATVTTRDAAGNLTTADAQHAYGVDVSAPTASITIDNVTADNVINAAESGQTIAVTGKVGDDVRAGDEVTVTIGGESYQTTVNTDGQSWSVNVPGSVLAANSDISATVTTRDTAGNITTADAQHTYGVDFSAPTASITIDNVTADNVINAAESGQTIAVTGKVGDDVRAGDAVTVTIGGESYQTTVNADGESWSVNVPGAVLAANGEISATVTTRDAAGNVTTADTNHNYGVDVSAPVASITIDNVTADNVINAAESGQSIAVTGKVGDEVKAGDAITVTVGSESYQTTVNADGLSWSVSVPGSVLAANGEISATVIARDAAGNVTTADAQHTYGVDINAPVASISIDNVTADNVINAAESGQSIAVTGKVGDDVRAGDAVTVTIGGETYHTTVNADGLSWSVSVPGTVLAANGEISATVTARDAAGNVTTADTNHTYGVDISAPVASITIDDITADNVINAAESGQSIAVTGKVGDEVKAGDAVTVTVGGETYQTTVNADGQSWSVNVPGSVLAANGDISATVTTRDAAGNLTTANAQHAYGVDTVAPTASITIDNVTADNVINAAESGQTIAVTGKVGDDVRAGDAITVTVGGETYQTTVNADGLSWSVNVPGTVLAANGDISATVTTRDAAGNLTTANAQHTYGVDVSAPVASISIDNVTADNVINAAESGQSIAVTGKVGDDVRAGDAVTVTIGGETYQTSVNADGLSWSVNVPGSVLSAVASITIDNVTADNVINAAESGQTIAVTGKVGDEVKAGDGVTVTVGGETYQTTVNADGQSWSVSVPGSVLAANTDISATVTTRDAAGNVTTADTNHTYGVDISAPVASITIDNVTSDNVINAAESGQTIAVTGKVGDEVKAGDAITVTVGSESYQTTVNADGLSWSVNVPGSVLSANSDISATVTTRDTAGNITTADAQHTYGVDVSAPVASITIDNVTADNVINTAESGQTIAVTGRVGDDVRAGDAVTVTVGGETYQTTVNADGLSWSVNVPGAVLAANGEISATVTTRDAAGNLTTANAQHTYGVDVSAPTASITIDNVTTDNVINAAESGQTIAVTGKVGDEVKAGDAITVTVGGESYQTTVNADGLSWSVNVPGSVLAANNDISATVTTRDVAGNVTTADTNHTYGVDVSAPVASITIDNVTADNVINAAESGQTIAVTGKVGDDVRAGDEVTVTIGGESYQTTVNADGLSWSVSVPGSVLAANSDISATVTTRDEAGNLTTADAQHTYGVDVSAPTASITIDNVTADNVINAAESGQTIAVTGKVGDDVRAGDVITVSVGNETYQTTVNADGLSWSVNVPGSVLSENSDISATVTTRDAAGNVTTANAQHTYGVDVSAPVASISIDNVTADNVINAAESGQSIAVTGKVGDEVKAGDTITVTVGSETYQTTVNADGLSWSVNVPGAVLAANGDISATVTTRDAAGNLTTADAQHAYGVDVSAPTASITIDNVTADNVINAAESGETIAVTGRVGDDVRAGDAVTVTVGGETYQTTVNVDGESWSVNVPGSVLAANSDISATVTTRDAAGNITTANAQHTYGVDTVAPTASITIDDITADNVINAAESGETIAVTGRVGDDVRAGDAVTVTVGGETYQTTVNVDGESWSVNVPGTVLAANTDISATVTTRDAAGNVTTADAQHTYGVDINAPVASISIDNVTADNVINAAESGQTIAVTGRVGDDVRAGDAITVTIGSETYQTTVNVDGLSWSVSVPGSVLAANGEISATVTTRDAVGNVTTADAQHAYGVDISAPEIVITDFAGNDGFVSQNELKNTVISGTSSEKTVDLLFTDMNGKSISLGDVPVTNGKWQANIDLSPLAEGKIVAGATATDSAGNQAYDDSLAIMDITPPVAHDNSVSGVEDTSLPIDWHDFGVSADTTSIVMSSLPPASVGTLYFNDSGNWTAVTVGQTFTAANTDLRFTPANNVSGVALGDIGYRPVDSAGNLGSDAALHVDLTPVADAPVVSLNITSGATTPTSLEIIKVNGGSTNGGFDVQNGKIIAVGDGVRVWLTEGDPIPTVVGSGKVAYYSQSNINGDGGYSDIFVVHSNSGYFYRQGDWPADRKEHRDLDSLNGNRSSNGSSAQSDYVFVMKEEGYTYSAAHNTNNNQGTSVNTLDGLKVNYTDSSGKSGSLTTQTSNNIEGVIYSDGSTYTPGTNSAAVEKIPGQPGSQLHTLDVSATLTDLDGSERLSGITLTGIPQGTVLTDYINNVTYTVGADGTYLINNANNAMTLAGKVTIDVPIDAGKFNVVAQATSTEIANYDTATGYSSGGVEQYGLHVGTVGDDKISGTHSHDVMVGDVSGLQIIEGKNYNIAFMVDSSGSMSATDIAHTRASLIDVFENLVNSANSANSGTVNVFLADFDSQVGKTVSVNMTDANALNKLTAVLDSMVGGSTAGGGTNYEDVFKTTANWFQSDAVKNNVGNNLTYFITDGEPTYYQTNETNEVRVSDWWQSLNIDNIAYQPGQSYYMDVRGAQREVIDTKGNVYQYSASGWYGVSRTVIGQVHAQGDGTYEISSLGGAGNNGYWARDIWGRRYWVDNSVNRDDSNENAAQAFDLLKKHSTVEAIGIGSDLNGELLKHYDTDGIVQDHIDPEKLNEAILGSSEPMNGGNDELYGGLGNDILFGDSVSFPDIDGNGIAALQNYIGKQLGMQTGVPTAKEMHSYMTTHSAEFDLSSEKEGNDILNGGAGNDLLFGQGGNDILIGGEGNDLLYGGTGDDILIGGAGGDTLVGGAGADIFRWQSGDIGNDVIKDFNAKEGDRIDLSDLIGELEEGTDISRYIRITENHGSPTIEVSTAGDFAGDKGGTVAVSITLEHYSGALPSLESLVSKPELSS